MARECRDLLFKKKKKRKKESQINRRKVETVLFAFYAQESVSLLRTSEHAIRVLLDQGE